MSLVNQFIVNLMSQHVIPFWVTLIVLFIVVTEIIYFKQIRGEKYRGSLGEFAILNKIYSLLITVWLFGIIWGIFIVLEMISHLIVPILVVIGVSTIIVGYFYSNYLVAKKYAVKEKSKHNFKEGDKLVVVDAGKDTGLVNGQVVTFLRDNSRKGIINVLLANGEIEAKKENRFKKKKR